MSETKTARRQIGTVRIMRDRVYRLDPMAADDDALATTVLVQSGEYPVYLDGLSRYWRMTGVLNHRSYRMGDGMFAFNEGGDVASEDDVVFYSRRYGPDEWAGLMADFAADPRSSLVFTIAADTPEGDR